MKYEEVKLEGSRFELSLNKIIGSKVKDIAGYLSTEFDALTFKMTRIIFEDGSVLGCEGEHDCPYLVGYGDQTAKNYSDENLEEIRKTDPGYEGEK